MRADSRFQAIFLRGHIALLAKGMKNSRGLTLTKALELTTELTQIRYPRTTLGADQARKDLYLLAFPETKNAAN